MRTSSGSVRTAAAAALLAAAALALTACSPRTGPPAEGVRSGSPATPAAGSPGSSTGSSTGATGTGPAGGTSSSGSPPAVPGGSAVPCRTGQLAVAQTGAEVGAGQYYSRLVFTNVSGSTCTLTGYPGVSYVAAGGVQSGNAARRSAGRVATVVLAPRGSAGAVLHDSNGVGGYSPGQCRLTLAAGLRIYPPDQRAALFLPWRTQHCAGPDVYALTIGPVQG